MKDPHIDEVLHYWFGNVNDATLPSPERTRLWFSVNPEADHHITELFQEDIEKAIQGEYHGWENTSHGRLALIILLDQFSRNVYRGQVKAFSQDQEALHLCIEGIKLGHDHTLSLIERAFFYMPMLHSEDIHMQERSILAFQMLATVSLPELAVIFKELLAFAVWHYETVKRFGRFPQRNSILGRESTPEELEFLQ